MLILGLYLFIILVSSREVQLVYRTAETFGSSDCVGMPVHTSVLVNDTQCAPRQCLNSDGGSIRVSCDKKIPLPPKTHIAWATFYQGGCGGNIAFLQAFPPGCSALADMASLVNCSGEVARATIWNNPGQQHHGCSGPNSEAFQVVSQCPPGEVVRLIQCPN